MLEQLEFNSAGVFFVEVNMAGERNPRHERVEFRPSPETPSILDYISRMLNKTNAWNRIERLEIRKSNGNGMACTFFKSQLVGQD